MTDEELKTARHMLLTSLEAAASAATKYREALEFFIPLCGGDPELIVDARRSELWRLSYLEQIERDVRNATPEEFGVTFQKRGEQWQ